MRTRVLFILFFISAKILSAQFDTNFVHITKNRFSVSPLFEFYKSSYRVKSNGEEQNELEENIDKSFTSKNNLYLGFGLTFYRIGIAVTFQLPYSNIPELKKMKSFSFVGGYSFKRLYGELRYRNYKGLEEQTITYTEDSVLENTRIRQNIHFQQIGGALYYFTSKKYNYDANFKNYNIQKKSAISPVFVSGLNYYELKGKFEDIDSVAIIIDNFLKVFSFKLTGGLAGSIVYKSFYASMVSNIGIAVNRDRYIDSETDETSIKTFPSLEIRASFGYNSDKFFASVSYIYDNDLLYFYPYKIGINNYFMNFKLGYKFDSKYLGKAAKYL